MFTQKDRQQLANMGIAESQALQQIANFRNGFSFADLLKPAIVGDGIIRLTEEETKKMISIYDASAGKMDVLKFVPASGAATRMFKDVYNFGTDLKTGISAETLFIKYPDANIFFENIEKFPFYEDLNKATIRPVKALLENKEYQLILEHFLDEKGLNYGSLPKGLLKFHRYDGLTRTSVEEHWVEGASYAKHSSGIVKVHFTISPNHEDKFKELINKSKKDYEATFGIKLEITYSFQKSSTDVIAVNMQNEPFRESDGSLVFRPGGHGALLENLNDCNSDLIFIKNIDNIVPDRLKAETIIYKKALAGIIISYRDKIFEFIRRLENDSSEILINEVVSFIQNELHYFGVTGAHADYKAYLISILNRPIRACGMVKNEGEPGGGPYWVKDKVGNISLQIVESSQVAVHDPLQKEIFSKATHFNPVDLVCLVKNYKGEKFNLPDFRDPDTGFITIKSKDGKSLKAQELPGLWNGAMAYWNTFFVEVPLITFNPVKSVNDLLRSNHI
jgi:hypothetical protein